MPGRRYAVEASDLEARGWEKLAQREGKTVAEWLPGLANDRVRAGLGVRRCKVCGGELSLFARPEKEYCSDACYERGRRRRRAGLPEDFLPLGCQGKALRDFVGPKRAA